MAISFVGSVANSTINGTNLTLTLPSNQANDCVIVAYSVPRSITMGVTSSSTTTAYTQIVTTLVSGTLRYSVWRRIVPTSETQAICTGTGNAQDASAGVAFVFRGVSTSTPEDATATSTTGLSSQADSPSITVVSCSDAILTMMGLLANTAATAPSSFLNATSTGATDTQSCFAAGAWITNATTAALNPLPWTGFTAVSWGSATVALMASTVAPFVWFAPTADPANIKTMFRLGSILGY